MKHTPLLLFSTVTAILLASVGLPAQTLTVLHTFGATPGLTNTDGIEPHSALLLSGDTLYGVTPFGGSIGYGTVFSMQTNGSNFTVLHSFTGGSDGAVPAAGLILSGNTLYGLVAATTNVDGGSIITGYGSIFSIQTNGSNFTTVYLFTNTALGVLSHPNGGLTLDGDTLYGTTYSGGVSNAGVIFSVSTNGSNYQLLHQFVPATDGENPLGTLVFSGGTLYGTARNGGSNGVVGTVFSIGAGGGGFTVMHTFDTGTLDGHNPDAGLTLDGDTLYGTTVFGGTNNGGAVFAINTDDSNYVVLHSFNTSAGEGKIPESGLTLAGDTLYGTTLGGSNGLSGTVYSLKTNGNAFVIYARLSDNEDGTNISGSQPYGEPQLAGNNLYGTTSLGGINGNGTLFSVTIVPQLTGIAINGSNLTLTGINGVPDETYSILSSGDPSMPLSAWTFLTSATLSNGGNFSITATNGLNRAVPQQFYVVQPQ